jgi:hypothetical protein
MRLLLTGALLCVCSASAAAQSPTPDPPAYVFEYSTVPMIRNAALAELGMRLGERGTDWLLHASTGDVLARPSPSGMFARTGQIGVDILIVAIMGSAAHEYGHAARSSELGGSPVVTIGLLGGGYFRARFPRPLLMRERLSIFGGGLEGSAVLAARTGDRIHRDGVATPADLTLVIMNSVGSELYILRTLTDDRLSSPERFFEGGPRGLPGDPGEFVIGLAGVRLSNDSPSRGDPVFFAGIQTAGQAVRRGSLINFVDFELFAAAAGLSRDFVAKGHRRIDVRWLRLGGVSLAPRLAYFLTPNGPERQVRSRVKMGAHVGQTYVRWSETLTPAAGRLVGAGGDYQRTGLKGIMPKLAFDAWKNPDGTSSARGEISALITRGLRDRFVLTVGAGGKGRGYLQGYALAAGAYASIGGGLRF